MAAEKESKPAPKGGDAAAAPAKAPMFSKAGLMVLVAGCVVSGAVGALVLGSGKHPPEKPNGGEAHPEEHAPEHSEAPAPSKGPLIRNTVLLEPIQVNYQDTGVGTARRTFTITAALELQTNAGVEGVEATEEAKRKAADDKRLKDVERLKPWITDRIFGILRGKTPENFATNEMVDQVKQQIRHAINEEKFGGQDVVQNVLFVQQRF